MLNGFDRCRVFPIGLTQNKNNCCQMAIGGVVWNTRLNGEMSKDKF